MRQTPDTTEARNGQEISPGEGQAFFQQFIQDPPGMVGVYRGVRSSQYSLPRCQWPGTVADFLLRPAGISGSRTNFQRSGRRADRRPHTSRAFADSSGRWPGASGQDGIGGSITSASRMVRPERTLSGVHMNSIWHKLEPVETSSRIGSGGAELQAKQPYVKGIDWRYLGWGFKGK